MSRVVIELLKSCDLVDRNGKPANLMRMADVDLGRVMDHYLNARLADLDTQINREASRSGFAALMTSTSAEHDLGSLLSSSLVYEKVFIDDPLLHETRRENTYTHGNGSVMTPVNSLDRKSIAQKVRRLLDLAPLIENGVVSVFPVSQRHTLGDALPLYYSEDNFDSCIAPHIRSFVYESARISDVIPRNEGGLAILPSSPTERKRIIAVRFEQDHFRRPGKVYFLSTMRAIGETEKGLHVEQDLDLNRPVDEKTYANWLRNATNSAVLTRLRDASHEMALADKLSAIYLTDSGFEAKLFALPSGNHAGSDSRTTAVNFLNANAGFLNIQSALQVARLRADSPQLFDKFQASLLHVCTELIGVEDGFEDKARQLYTKEVEPHVQSVAAQLSKTKTQGLVSGILAAAPFGLALLNLIDVPFGVTVAAIAGSASAAVLQGIASTLPALSEWRHIKKTVPYIWSQLARG